MDNHATKALDWFFIESYQENKKSVLFLSCSNTLSLNSLEEWQKELIDVFNLRLGGLETKFSIMNERANKETYWVSQKIL